MNPRTPVNLAVFLKNLLDLGGEPGIFSFLFAHRTLFPGIIAAFGDIQRSTHHPDRVFLQVICNELIF
jgi:hypothetical protein